MLHAFRANLIAFNGPASGNVSARKRQRWLPWVNANDPQRGPGTRRLDGKPAGTRADVEKLEAYNITIPQLIAALGNANINVGGREITVGQQSVNIRGVGLIDSGGADEVTKGYHVQDIENVVLSVRLGQDDIFDILTRLPRATTFRISKMSS